MQPMHGDSRFHIPRGADDSQSGGGSGDELIFDLEINQRFTLPDTTPGRAS